MPDRRQIKLILLLLASILIISLAACSPQIPLPPPENGTEAENIPLTEIPGNGADYNASSDKQPDISPEEQQARVGIYSGTGSWELNVEAIVNFLDYCGLEQAAFNEDSLSDDSFQENFDLIWFPGGFAAEYKNLLPPSAHTNISSFIESGGAFIGSCAGAYYAAGILRWQGSDYQYPLGLFSGTAAGPLSGLIASGEVAAFHLDQDHPLNENFEATLDMYYFDGPYFIPTADDRVFILARYEVNDEPAVIAGRFGSGKYLLLGPHPELGGYSPGSPQSNLDGGEGAQWPWLEAVLDWFIGW